MKGYLPSILLALSNGLLGAFQATVNTQIGKATGQYMMIIGVSLIQAVISSLILLKGGWGGGFTTGPLLWMMVSGVLGVIMMVCITSSIGSIGTLSVFVLVISGQIISSALIDHFGLLGPARPISIHKVGSILVIMSGVFWLVKSS